MKRKLRDCFFTILLIVFTGIFYNINAAPGELDITFAFTGLSKKQLAAVKPTKYSEQLFNLFNLNARGKSPSKAR